MRTFWIVLLYTAAMSSAFAQLSAPPAFNRASPKADTKHAALLLDPSLPARRIVLAAPTAQERAAALAPKGATKAKDSSKPMVKAARLQIGFARVVPEADQVIELASLDWRAAGDGSRAARLTITSASAAALRVGVRIKDVPPELTMRFMGSSPAAQPFGPFAVDKVRRPSVFWSPVLEGDTATVELALPAGAAAQGTLQLTRVSHLLAAGVTLSSNANLKALDIGAADTCETDVACLTTDMQAQARTAVNATARVLITTDGNTYLCTGTLLNDAVSSNVPYFYTANHCLDNTDAPGDTKAISAEASDTINTYWFFQASACNSTAVPAYALLAGGATLLARGVDYDWALVRLNDTPPAGATFAAWNATGPLANGTSVIGIHHPEGDLKKVSQGSTTGYQTYDDGSSFLRVRWELGVTEPGSSGSGLFTFNNAVGAYELRGGLYGGGSSCTTPRTPDAYSRLDVGYPLLQQYLAPAAPHPNGEVVVVEFYNVDLDDYFITAAPAEIADLDAGVHPGWVRTGLRFLAYGNAQSAPSGAVPVCRFYVRPEVGDSHFYSASVAECAATLARFGASWAYESAAVFYVLLPDPTTGSCGANMKPIYRFYNAANGIHHRYTTEVDVRDDLIAQGVWKQEGYGLPPEQVVMCAPPA